MGTGFTKIDHEILEEVSKRKFTATQLQILMVVWRMTYGFNREDHELALNYLTQATGFSKRNIQEGLNGLIDSRVLVETQSASFNKSRKLAFNKNTGDWKVHSRVTVPEMNCSSPLEPQSTSTVEPEFTSTVEPQITQDRKDKEISKERYHDSLPNPYEEFRKCFGPITERDKAEIKRWIMTLGFKNPELIICETIQRVKNYQDPASPSPYIRSVLNKLVSMKLFTIEQVREHNKSFDENKKKKVSKSPKKDPGKDSILGGQVGWINKPRKSESIEDYPDEDLPY